MMAPIDWDKNICPFTLEPFHNCFISSAVSTQQECPFTLESCSQQREKGTANPLKAFQYSKQHHFSAERRFP